jgi:hypothetical protein
VFSPSFGSPSLYPDGTIKKRQKQNLFSLRWQGKWRYGFWFEQNGIPGIQQMLLFELEPEKIVKNTMKNYGAMDLFKLFYGLVINDT